MPIARTHRFGATALAIVLALWIVYDYHRWRSDIDRLDLIMEETGLAERHSEIVGEVRREPDPELARLRLAQALFASELDLRPRMVGSGS